MVVNHLVASSGFESKESCSPGADHCGDRWSGAAKCPGCKSKAAIPDPDQMCVRAFEREESSHKVGGG